MAKLVERYEESVNNVKECGNQDRQDFLARRLYEMTAELFMSLLIIAESPYFQDYKNRENTNYLLLFSDRIYIYRTYYKDLIEINEYVRRHYKKPKKFVEWVMNVLYAFK